VLGLLERVLEWRSANRAGFVCQSRLQFARATTRNGRSASG
jgi:hypothetical protein